MGCMWESTEHTHARLEGNKRPFGCGFGQAGNTHPHAQGKEECVVKGAVAKVKSELAKEMAEGQRAKRERHSKKKEGSQASLREELCRLEAVPKETLRHDCTKEDKNLLG